MITSESGPNRPTPNSNADTKAHGNGNADSNGDSKADGHSDTDSNGNTKTHGNTNADSNGDTKTHGNTNAIGTADANWNLPERLRNGRALIEEWAFNNHLHSQKQPQQPRSPVATNIGGKIRRKKWPVYSLDVQEH